MCLEYSEWKLGRLGTVWEVQCWLQENEKTIMQQSPSVKKWWEKMFGE